MMMMMIHYYYLLLFAHSLLLGKITIPTSVINGEIEKLQKIKVNKEHTRFYVVPST